MQAWTREQDPDRIGTALHTRFNRSFTEGARSRRSSPPPR